jgi:hypothetical protein
VSFMLQIERAQPPALERLALAWLSWRHGLAGASAPAEPSWGFLQQAAEVPASDIEVARRLGVPVAIVRTWRARGGRGRR